MSVSESPLRVTPANCASCPYRGPCGGLDGNGDVFGCFHCVGSAPCPSDAACPTCNWEGFVRMGVEINWFGFDPKTRLQPFTAALPSYIPKQHHAYRRSRRVPLPWVAVSLSALFKLDRRRRHYQARFTKVDRLRKALRVADETQVIVCSASHDDEIELFWEFHRQDNAPRRLKSMGVVGATTPNFSFFSDSPRPASMRNRKRILLSAERFADAGLPTILHLNAQTRADWSEWAEILRHQPRMSTVAKEFQTGHKDIDSGRAAWDRLSELEQRLGRPLHVLAIGAPQFLTYAAGRVANVTLVDSDPFIKTQMRQQCAVDRNGTLYWVKQETKKGAPLDDLYESNVRIYTSWVERTLQMARPMSAANGQLALPFGGLRRAG